MSPSKHRVGSERIFPLEYKILLGQKNRKTPPFINNGVLFVIPYLDN